MAQQAMLRRQAAAAAAAAAAGDDGSSGATGRPPLGAAPGSLVQVGACLCVCLSGSLVSFVACVPLLLLLTWRSAAVLLTVPRYCEHDAVSHV